LILLLVTSKTQFGGETTDTAESISRLKLKTVTDADEGGMNEEWTEENSSGFEERRWKTKKGNVY